MKKLGTLKYKFTIITFFTYMIIVNSVLLISYFRFSNFMLSSRKELGYEILNLVNNEINADHIDDYLDGKYLVEYNKSLKEIQYIKDSFRDVYFLYAYKIPNEGSTATVLFDVNTEHDDKGDKLGDDYELEPGFMRNIKALRKGDPVSVLSDYTEYGYLMTVMQPIRDSNNNLKGLICIDFDLTALRQSNVSFVVLLFVLMLIAVILILTGVMQVMNRRILGPIEKMYLCLKDFKYTNDYDRVSNLYKLQSLDIHTNEEIQSLYEELLRITGESYTYMEEYKLATERLGVASEMAYYDSLTGLYNKNSYNDKIKEFQNRIENKLTFELAVIMVDINNLKYVNDTFGHQFGDDYIRGCCSIIVKCVAGAPIYRIGGDEFIVLLEEDPFVVRKAIYENLKSEFDYAFTNGIQPYEKYSASVGMSTVRVSDRSIKDVITRADTEMYNAKAKFREKYGSYR